MENITEPLDARLADSKAGNLTLTEEIAKYWLGIANWALFFAVLLFLFAGILIFLAVVSVERNLVFNLLFLGFAAVFFVPAFLLTRFRNTLKKALFNESPEFLERSFRAFRHFYLLCGILTIAATVFYASFIAYGIFTAPSPDTIQEFER